MPVLSTGAGDNGVSKHTTDGISYDDGGCTGDGADSIESASQCR